MTLTTIILIGLLWLCIAIVCAVAWTSIKLATRVAWLENQSRLIVDQEGAFSKSLWEAHGRIHAYDRYARSIDSAIAETRTSIETAHKIAIEQGAVHAALREFDLGIHEGKKPADRLTRIKGVIVGENVGGTWAVLIDWTCGTRTVAQFLRQDYTRRAIHESLPVGLSYAAAIAVGILGDEHVTQVDSSDDMPAIPVLPRPAGHHSIVESFRFMRDGKHVLRDIYANGVEDAGYCVEFTVESVSKPEVADNARQLLATAKAEARDARFMKPQMTAEEENWMARVGAEAMGASGQTEDNGTRAWEGPTEGYRNEG